MDLFSAPRFDGIDHVFYILDDSKSIRRLFIIYLSLDVALTMYGKQAMLF